MPHLNKLKRNLNSSSAFKSKKQVDCGYHLRNYESNLLHFCSSRIGRERNHHHGRISLRCHGRTLTFSFGLPTLLWVANGHLPHYFSSPRISKRLKGEWLYLNLGVKRRESGQRSSPHAVRLVWQPYSATIFWVVGRVAAPRWPSTIPDCLSNALIKVGIPSHHLYLPTTLFVSNHIHSFNLQRVLTAIRFHLQMFRLQWAPVGLSDISSASLQSALLKLPTLALAHPTNFSAFLFPWIHLNQWTNLGFVQKPAHWMGLYNRSTLEFDEEMPLSYLLNVINGIK